MANQINGLSQEGLTKTFDICPHFSWGYLQWGQEFSWKRFFQCWQFSLGSRPWHLPVLGGFWLGRSLQSNLLPCNYTQFRHQRLNKSKSTWSSPSFGNEFPFDDNVELVSDVSLLDNVLSSVVAVLLQSIADLRSLIRVNRVKQLNLLQWVLEKLPLLWGRFFHDGAECVSVKSKELSSCLSSDGSSSGGIIE